ncbi:hypothetical protein LV716_00095 [Flagellimonas sp. HMM57]|uniref:hypothetical protein n=1 Tax=unclassified Flagellimonas TaxID=2644544 RepID=UPI0013D247FE|nr:MULTISPECIES: hypothetical protein [unclassified Flagellimonas]UII76234.1 hypothetical protein LV716_00095 [Flagellimonas sp. HMM57]
MNKLTILLLIVLTSCATITKVNSLADSKMNELLGKKIEILGTAVNTKLGAMLVTEDGSIWINGKQEWPRGYYYGDDNGKKLKVTGTVIKKYDLPVVIQKEGELPKSGIPVPEGTDIKEASRRYLLKNAKWKITVD